MVKVMIDFIKLSVLCLSAMLGDGQMWVWGSNRYGQLGVGPRDDDIDHILSPHRLPMEVSRVDLEMCRQQCRW